MDRTGLHTLLNLEVNSTAPHFIIYSEKENSRLSYAAKFVFENVLKTQISFTTNISDLENSKALKINYSSKKVDDAFHIKPHTLLFETGVSENKPKPVLKNNLIYFFETTGSLNFDYDIFAAVFYFISRYEEWQSFEADAHGRFEAKASILFQNKMHLKPVVDIWINEFKNAMILFFKAPDLPANKFKVISTIDVDNLYAYKAKGFLRTTGSIGKDLLKFDLKNLRARINVLFKRKQDPFDIYASVSEFCLNNNIPLIYFFLFRTGTKYDRTIEPASPAFINVFQQLKKFSAHIGLHPSYYASENEQILTPEREMLSQRAGEKIMLSRQHYLKFNIRNTPQKLIQSGLDADFTMGFASSPGFRAGTSFPFYYYDFVTERHLQLLFTPFCAMDGAYFVYDKISPDKMLSSFLELAGEVKKVNGIFISVFHERTFSGHLYPGYDQVYKKFHQKVKEL